jgi:hypothetical protein
MADVYEGRSVKGYPKEASRLFLLATAGKSILQWTAMFFLLCFIYKRVPQSRVAFFQYLCRNPCAFSWNQQLLL